MTPSRPRSPVPTAHGLLGACLLLSLVACSGQAGAPTSTPSATAAIATTPIAEPTSKPTSSPRTPAPTELQGTWRTVINDADKPALTITDFKYTIERLGIGTGAVEVNGDQISFFGSNLCPGRGTYSWSIANGTLTLESVAPDPCANRADAIRGRPFTRIK